eukprot:TRINITY_DN1326_c0_g1_i4.p1 TRINITY_DN1326_c0_g1~~TRINITY_DN1326_c0_g1_i4.p1  ORF type:complete len:140 (-),score=14.38 TRINITY_DN1326_c0_g1_i4:36-455(-)
MDSEDVKEALIILKSAPLKPEQRVEALILLKNDPSFVIRHTPPEELSVAIAILQVKTQAAIPAPKPSDSTGSNNQDLKQSIIELGETLANSMKIGFEQMNKNSIKSSSILVFDVFSLPSLFSCFIFGLKIENISFVYSI